MVRGIDTFREHFKAFADAFVVIGGVACDEWFTSQGLKFRATKDVDMVLVVEALSTEFIKSLWTFIRRAGYVCRRGAAGQRLYYRFDKPDDPRYPAMIELFSRQPSHLDLADGQQIVPIAVDEDASSLSAILMDDAYYDLIIANRRQQDGLPIVNPVALIPLKARAWLDLTRRAQEGYQVDGRDLKKHRNDVFRLAATLPGERGPAVAESIRRDLQLFMETFPPDSKDWPAILDGIKGTLGPNTPKPVEIVDAISGYFAL